MLLIVELHTQLQRILFLLVALFVWANFGEGWRPPCGSYCWRGWGHPGPGRQPVRAIHIWSAGPNLQPRKRHASKKQAYAGKQSNESGSWGFLGKDGWEQIQPRMKSRYSLLCEDKKKTTVSRTMKIGRRIANCLVYKLVWGWFSWFTGNCSHHKCLW